MAGETFFGVKRQINKALRAPFRKNAFIKIGRQFRGRRWFGFAAQQTHMSLNEMMVDVSGHLMSCLYHTK